MERCFRFLTGTWAGIWLSGGLDDEPVVYCFNDIREEIDLIGSLHAFSPQELINTCITIRRPVDMERYLMAFEAADIPCYKVDHNALDDTDHDGVRIATMHQVKGLEFDSMYVVGVNNDVLPLVIKDSDDLTINREHEQRERSLLYVAITRAKRFCSISGFGALSNFIRALEK